MYLVKIIFIVGLFLFVVVQVYNVLEFFQLENNLEEFYVVIEILMGGIIKYEIDVKMGFIVVDCFQLMLVVYLVNYGLLIQLLVGDGDLLDVVFYICVLMVLGMLIKLWVIGVLKMIDGGEKDDKIIVVLVSKIDLIYDDIKIIFDLLKIEQQWLEVFFWVYKELLEGCKKVELVGFNDVVVVKQEIKLVWEVWKVKNL